MSDLYPDPTPVRFEAYAFDETYLRELPEAPGVYVMRDQQGQVIYVGKAVNLRQRVGSYFAKRAERPEKTKRILERIWSMEVETVGSELEALILESRLIALCQPMFNTQVVVHDRDVDLGALKNWLLILPSAEDGCVELFCVVQSGALLQLRVRQDLRDWDMAVGLLKERYFQNGVHEQTLSAPEKAEMAIVLGWVGLKKEALNVLDMDGLGTPDNALRIVSEYVQHCERENWEKVVWRV
jgi:predicted GIY-YIG superfamily endonuclease